MEAYIRLPREVQFHENFKSIQILTFSINYPQLVEMILINVDCPYDISNCALVCHEWLDIINKHRAIETSIVLKPSSIPFHKIFVLRRFTKISFKGLRFRTVPKILGKVLENAKEVIFDKCEFHTIDILEKLILACGRLTRLEIYWYPKIPLMDIELGPEVTTTNPMAHEFVSLVLGCEGDEGLHILEFLHKNSIRVNHLDLFMSNV
jgi:hypothetical protein